MQKIINKKSFLSSVVNKGNFLRDTLNSELKNHEFFINTRGRGLRNSLEYDCENKHLFGIALTELAKNKYKMLISAKWHRVCFSNAINIKKNDLDKILDKFIISFKEVSKNWTRKKIKKVKFRSFY